MKKIRTLFIVLGCIFFPLSDSNSGLLGDVDLDGTIGLTEAVHALQVTSGVRSPLSSSYVIVWKGTWVTGQNYQVYDAVRFGGSSYICLQSHASDVANEPPYAPVWEPLALKGDTGATGQQGPQGEPGPLNPNIVMAGNNTAVGMNALYANTTGNSNTASGYSALVNNTTGSGNTASGTQALFYNTEGYHNTASGGFALSLNTTGVYNTAGGHSALYKNTTGRENTANGSSALFSNTIGDFNTASGSSALYFNTEGVENTASGYQALYFNTTGYRNSASGCFALLRNTTGVYNTAGGHSALYSNTSGYENTASGSEALYSNTTGNSNTASGSEALYSNTTGNSNTAIGVAALSSNTTGNSNTASGVAALWANTTGHDNTASGSSALFSNATGYGNTASGSSALYWNTIGNSNTSNGGGSLYSNTTGNSNTACGVEALYSNTTGYGNTAIGFQAGEYLLGDFSGNNNIYVGYQVYPASASESNTIRIGSGQTAAFIAGISGATTSSGVAVYVNASGQLGTVTSSRRYKENIEDMGDASSGLMLLRPVAFRYKPEYTDGPRTRQYGLIAEEVAEVYPHLVQYDPKTGAPQAVLYHLVNAMLLNEVQKQQQQILEQKAELSVLKERLSKLEALLIE